MTTAQSEIDALLSAPERLTPEEVPPLDPSSVPQSSLAAGTRAEPSELAHILHMQVPIIVKLAERDLPLGTVLKLNIGSILEFTRPVDAEMELLVNNRVVGKGLPVKVGENFGLRLTFVGNLEMTIQALGSQ